MTLNSCQAWNSTACRPAVGVILVPCSLLVTTNCCLSFINNCLCKGPDELEFIMFSISCGNSKMTLGVLYGPPNSCTSLFDTLMFLLFKYV